MELTSDMMIQFAWITLGGFVTFSAGIVILGSLAFLKGKDSSASFIKMIENTQTLKLVTVALIILCVTFLTFLKILEPDGAIGIFSGIAGYVLGGLEKTRSTSGNNGI